MKNTLRAIYIGIFLILFMCLTLFYNFFVALIILYFLFSTSQHKYKKRDYIPTNLQGTEIELRNC